VEYTDAELTVDGLCDIPCAESCRDDMDGRSFDPAANDDKRRDPFIERNRFGFDMFGTTAEGAENEATSPRSMNDGNDVDSSSCL
jgi:hypothetical protein